MLSPPKRLILHANLISVFILFGLLNVYKVGDVFVLVLDMVHSY